MMDQLFSKLTNLGYEIFGVILPGVILLIFLVFWWIALGSIAPQASQGFFPQLTSSNAEQIIESISVRTGVGILIPVLISTYFFGHLLLWISKEGIRNDAIVKSFPRRVIHSLAFEVPRHTKSYGDGLEKLLSTLLVRFALPGDTLAWGQFYPIARTFIARSSSFSLVSTYQIKYTLHRSVTAASAALFWLCLMAFGWGLVNQVLGIAESPRYTMLICLGIFSLVACWGFSASYAYNWKLFGDYIISETYSILAKPIDEKP